MADNTLYVVLNELLSQFEERGDPTDRPPLVLSFSRGTDDTIRIQGRSVSRQMEPEHYGTATVTLARD